MGNKLAYILIAAGFAALIFLNPGKDRHRHAFMNYAHAHFFELPPGYRDVYEQLRGETLGPQTYERLRYGNFLLFSTLSYNLSFGMREGKQWRDRRPLTIGVLGFVFPVIVEPQHEPSPAE